MLEFDPMKLDEATGSVWLRKYAEDDGKGVREFWDNIVKLVGMQIDRGEKPANIEAKIIGDLHGLAEIKAMPPGRRAETIDLATAMIRQAIRGLSHE